MSEPFLRDLILVSLGLGQTVDKICLAELCYRAGNLKPQSKVSGGKKKKKRNKKYLIKLIFSLIENIKLPKYH